jgi:hypothetical protein
MPANIDPVYSRIGAAGNSTVAAPTTAFATQFGATANTTLDLSSTTGSQIVFTADATNGSFLRSIVIKWSGTSQTQASTAAVMRFWWNNGGTAGTAGNQFLWKEFALPVITPSATATTPEYEIPCNVLLPQGHRIYAAISATQTTNGYHVAGIGGHL